MIATLGTAVVFLFIVGYGAWAGRIRPGEPG